MLERVLVSTSVYDPCHRHHHRQSTEVLIAKNLLKPGQGLYAQLFCVFISATAQKISGTAFENLEYLSALDVGVLCMRRNGDHMPGVLLALRPMNVHFWVRNLGERIGNNLPRLFRPESPLDMFVFPIQDLSK